MRCFLFLLVWFPCYALAQTLPSGVGFSGFSAENGVAQQDAFSIFNNPATLQKDTLTVGISAQSVFESAELFHFTVGSQIPTAFGTFGAGIHRFGDNLMNETTATIGVGKQLFDDFSIGIGLHYFTTQAQFAKSASTIYPQVGMAYQFNDELRFGFTARNPISQELKEPFEQNLQSFYSAGLLYQPSREFRTTLQANVWEREGISAGFGVNYQAFDNIAFLLGGKTNPGIMSAGAIVHLSQFKLGVGGKHQSPLGLSPQFVVESQLK